MDKKNCIFYLLLLLVFSVNAAKVDTVLVKSLVMDKDIKVVTVAPDKKGIYPVVYLLHGHGGNYKSWILTKPELPEIADGKGIIFVCPDAENSWYWDSPKNPSSRYETFISKELVDYIDKHYPTVSNRKGRAISGLSMGGHGAMWLSLRHKDIYGAAGSMSGGLDIRPFPDRWAMKKQLGQQSQNKSVWDKHTSINLIDSLKNGELAIIIDCGNDDFFLEVNKRFHEKLLAKKIDHDFIVRPGTHNQGYWNNSIDYHILFFDKYFKKMR